MEDCLCNKMFRLKTYSVKRSLLKIINQERLANDEVGLIPKDCTLVIDPYANDTIRRNSICIDRNTY